MNTFGTLFRLTLFGSSHGVNIGGVIDGCPSGVRIDKDAIKQMMDRRHKSHGTSTKRREPDEVVFISGIENDVTIGQPIAFLIANKDVKKNDYDPLLDKFRPSHADWTYFNRYGLMPQSGGGMASARMTALWVVAGAIAIQLLRYKGIEIVSYTSQIGSIQMEPTYLDQVTLADVENSLIGCPIAELDLAMSDLLYSCAKSGNTSGGVVSTIVRGVPAGWGSPLFHKLDAQLAQAMMTINAAKAFEMGDGFNLATQFGSQANDAFICSDGSIHTATNHSGGVQAGISNGEVLRFRTAFKPISSILHSQKSVDVKGQETEIKIEGRHDTSVFPRVLPIVDAMTALVLVNELLHTSTYRLEI